MVGGVNGGCGSVVYVVRRGLAGRPEAAALVLHVDKPWWRQCCPAARRGGELLLGLEG
jgi:hypothetical protein